MIKICTKFKKICNNMQTCNKYAIGTSISACKIYTCMFYSQILSIIFATS
uniref:Uncharacterized protein n=1 Tax=Meloidogyne enterolobii TaxID=390850 RepID=A0A6V7U142_MELEN|nr:unnamed protein product [Meloidogyne enterolobii]